MLFGAIKVSLDIQNGEIHKRKITIDMLENHNRLSKKSIVSVWFSEEHMKNRQQLDKKHQVKFASLVQSNTFINFTNK